LFKAVAAFSPAHGQRKLAFKKALLSLVLKIAFAVFLTFS